MKIVVPIDFSVNSKIAVQFAVAIARQVKAELILLHVLPSLGPTIGRMPSTFLMQEMLQWTEKEFSQLEAEITSGLHVTHQLALDPEAEKRIEPDIQTNALAAEATADALHLTHQVAYGAGVENVIESFINTNAIDLIVMGSKGASGLKKILLGSNTVAVINNSSIPVIVVPEHAIITPITHLVYASDLKDIVEEVKCLLPFARLLQAAIKIIHIPPLQYLQHLHTERLVNNIRQQTNYQNIELELIEGENIVSTLEHYTAASHGEILAMFTHRCGFLEQIFSQSITREIVWHNRVPLLVIQKG